MAIPVEPVRVVLSLTAAGFAACLLAGCAAGASASKPPEDPAQARADALKKLSPEEITKSADEAAGRGEYDRAIMLYNQAIEVEPSADRFFRVGWIYTRLGKKSQAGQAFAMTLQQDPAHARAHEELGLLYLQSKQREQAAAHFRKAVESEPRLWRSHNALGVIADATGNHTDAVAHYEAALTVVPKSAMVMNNLGYSHYLAGEFARAAEIYEQALALEPGSRAVLANIGVLKARQKDYDGAVEVMGSAMDKAKAYNDVGYIALQNDDLAKAEELFEEAIRLSPTYYETAQQNLRRVRREREAAAAQTAAVTPD